MLSGLLSARDAHRRFRPCRSSPTSCGASPEEESVCKRHARAKPQRHRAYGSMNSPSGLSKRSKALFATLLSGYTHSYLGNLFMQFELEERLPSRANKLDRAMDIVKQSNDDPSVEQQLLELLRHILKLRGISPRTRRDLDNTELDLAESLT